MRDRGRELRQTGPYFGAHRRLSTHLKTAAALFRMMEPVVERVTPTVVLNRGECLGLGFGFRLGFGISLGCEPLSITESLDPLLQGVDGLLLSLVVDMTVENIHQEVVRVSLGFVASFLKAARLGLLKLMKVQLEQVGVLDLRIEQVTKFKLHS